MSFVLGVISFEVSIKFGEPTSPKFVSTDWVQLFNSTRDKLKNSVCSGFRQIINGFVNMAFFKTVPNLPDMEKARIEHALQRLADCLGAEKFLLPYQSLHSMVGVFQAPEQIVEFVGGHLAFDVTDVQLVVEPQILKKSGGGG